MAASPYPRTQVSLSSAAAGTTNQAAVMPISPARIHFRIPFANRARATSSATPGVLGDVDGIKSRSLRQWRRRAVVHFDIDRIAQRPRRANIPKLLFRFTSSGGSGISHGDWPRMRNNVRLDPPVNCGNDATREWAEVQIHRHQSNNDPRRVRVVAHAGLEHPQERLTRLG